MAIWLLCMIFCIIISFVMIVITLASWFLAVFEKDGAGCIVTEASELQNSNNGPTGHVVMSAFSRKLIFFFRPCLSIFGTPNGAALPCPAPYWYVSQDNSLANNTSTYWLLVIHLPTLFSLASEEAEPTSNR